MTAPWPFPTVAAAMARGGDNFALLRLLLALAVILSHGFSMGTGRHADEPLTLATGFTLGEHAVNGFFAVSGFLVTMSFCRRGWRDYVVARALRILPAFLVSVLVVALLLGPALTVLPFVQYLGDPGLWRFITATITTFKTAIALPGLFTDNPVAIPMGTVWTLKYETICYAGVLAAGLVGLLRSRMAAAAAPLGLFVALAVAEALDPALPKGMETALRLPLIFTAGGALYLLRDRLPLSGLVAGALFTATALLATTPLYKPMLFLATAYGAIWFAFLPLPGQARLNPGQDLSYGIYLYGWPVQQAIQALLPGLGPWPAIVLAIALTTPVALASWRLVEEPALRFKGRLIARTDPIPDARAAE